MGIGDSCATGERVAPVSAGKTHDPRTRLGHLGTEEGREPEGRTVPFLLHAGGGRAWYQHLTLGLAGRMKGLEQCFSNSGARPPGGAQCDAWGGACDPGEHAFFFDRCFYFNRHSFNSVIAADHKTQTNWVRVKPTHVTLLSQSSLGIPAKVNIAALL